MNLTDTAVRHFKGGDRPRKMADGKGLYLLVTPSGARYWRWKYRHAGREKVLALGVYPDVSVAQARAKHWEARLLLQTGVDPAAQRQEKRKELKSQMTFRRVAEKWYEHWAPTRRSHKIIWGRVQNNVLPHIGNCLVSDLSAPAFRDVAKRIESKSPTVAKHMLQVCGQIMRFAVAHGMAERNPVGDIQVNDILQARPVKNHARVDAKDLPELMHAIASYGNEPTRLAIYLLALTFVRTSELREAVWGELDLDNARWDIPAERMKMNSPHIVPLSRQAVSAFKRLKELSNGSDFVFPGRDSRAKAMSQHTMLAALRYMGFAGKMTGHGFRGLASTILHEQDYNHEHIELQLAHQSRGKVSAAYNHAVYLKPRAKMMQAWADYLDTRLKEYQPPA